MGTRGAPLTRRSVWIAQGITIAGLILYVIAVWLVAPALRAGAQQASTEVGLALAIVPALLWLLLFYVQDAREPEPLAYVLRVAVAGGVLAGAIAVPVLQRVVTTGSWLYASPLVGLLGSVFLIGGLQEFCVYLAVRFTVYEMSEFDEVADGVTYGTAAGLGLATVFNLWFVLGSPSIDPVPAALRIVVVAMGHAAFGGVLGYFLGRAKIFREHAGVLWGFLIAATLNGLVTFFLREVTHAGLSYRPWNGLVLASVVAVVVTLVLFRMVHRAPGVEEPT
jgi:RsiW-degrading membrane proteinase PrsW (M82 family)